MSSRDSLSSRGGLYLGIVKVGGAEKARVDRRPRSEYGDNSRTLLLSFAGEDEAEKWWDVF